MRAWAWPARLAVVAAVVVALLVDRSLGAEPDQPPPAPAPAGVPTEPVAMDPVSTSWYCPVVRTSRSDAAGGVEVAAQLVLGNRGPADLPVTITYVVPTAGLVSRVVDVPAGSSVVVDPAEDVTESQAAAVVEAPGGDLVVERRVGDLDSESCAAAPGQEWYLAGGDTSVDAVTSIVVFNPFPSDAVVDLVFASEAEPGPFTVLDLEGFVVPARTAQQIDLTEAVRRRTDVAMALVARSGSVVVDRLVSFDGTEGRVGLSLALAAPAPAGRWVWPIGRVDAATQMQVHVFNPNEEAAEIDVAPQFGSAAEGLVAVPVSVSVPPLDEVTIDVVPLGTESGRPDRIEVTPGSPFGLVVESANGLPVVVDIEVVNLPSPTTTTTTTTTTAPPTTAPPTTATPSPTTTAPSGSSTSATSSTTVATTTTTTTATTTTTTTTTVPDPSVQAVPEQRAEGGADMTVAASRLGRRWLVVGPRGDGLVSRLAVHNPTSQDVTVRVDVLGPDGATTVAQADVGAISAVELPLQASSAGALIVVEADGPVVVAVIAEVDGGVGVRQQLGWLVDQ